MKAAYIAVFEYASDGINISFPDFPGVFTCAFSREEAFFMAKDCLQLYVYGMKRTDLPKPKEHFDDRDNVEIVSVTIEMEVKDGEVYWDAVTEYDEN